MPAFYEIHDSILESMEWDGSALELTIRAVSTVSDGDAPIEWGRQRILVRIESATVTGDKVEPEIWLLDGEFNCESEISLPEIELKVASRPRLSRPKAFTSISSVKTRILVSFQLLTFEASR